MMDELPMQAVVMMHKLQMELHQHGTVPTHASIRSYPGRGPYRLGRSDDRTGASTEVHHPHVVPLPERRLTAQQLRKDESRLPDDEPDVTQILSGAHAATCKQAEPPMIDT